MVLTKLDGDARGGAALSVRHITGKPIKFVGVAEKLDGLEPFYPDRMAQRILGMGDILALVEEAQRGVDMEEAQKLAAKIKKTGGFDLEDFKAQIGQMKKMGGLGSLMDKLLPSWRNRRRVPTWTKLKSRFAAWKASSTA